MAVVDQVILGSAKNSAKLGGKRAMHVGETTTLRLLVEEESQLQRGGTQPLNRPASHLRGWLLCVLTRVPPMPSALSMLGQHMQLNFLITTLSHTLPQNTGG